MLILKRLLIWVNDISLQTSLTGYDLDLNLGSLTVESVYYLMSSHILLLVYTNSMSFLEIA